jgi:uncharacterized membrane protein
VASATTTSPVKALVDPHVPTATRRVDSDDEYVSRRHATCARAMSTAQTTSGHDRRLVNPALLEHAKERRESVENRIADRITAFSGSMRFVYVHLIWFGCWIGFGVESYPYALLTMIVSLEAIFLSTFVMISQNRADSKREALANQQWATVQDEGRQNEELLKLSRQILELTAAVHAAIADRPNSRPGTP